MILAGTLAIKSKIHPRMLEVKLKSFLTPSLRNNKLVSIERIRKKLKLENGPDKKIPSEETETNPAVDSDEEIPQESNAIT